MKKLTASGILLLSLILLACPYDGDVALCTYDEAGKADRNFLGEWVAFNEEGGRDELLIEKGNKAVMVVSHKKFEDGNKLKDKQRYRAFATEINGVTLFTLEREDGKYNYLKYEWTGKNEFNVQFIQKEYMEINLQTDSMTTESLKDFLKDHVNKNELYTAKMEYYKKYSPEYEKVRMYMKKSGF